MSTNGGSAGSAGRRLTAAAVAARRRSDAVSGLRSLARPRSAPPSAARPPEGEADIEFCDVCRTAIPEDHRHLLQLSERRIICACEPCWGMRAGEGDYRPTGQRTVWLPDLHIPEDVWAGFGIPIGLAFFMVSTVTECVVAMYPSPAGATESELRFSSWQDLLAVNPVLRGIEPDIEGLIVNRLADPPIHVIAPIDRCYALTGTIKAHWEGISGGPGVELAVERFFAGLRAEAVRA
jgi:hypothetical protein